MNLAFHLADRVDGSLEQLQATGRGPAHPTVAIPAGTGAGSVDGVPHGVPHAPSHPQVAPD
jgi:hypothetical protein